MKNRCPICGYPININENDKIEKCQNCNSDIDLDILLKRDSLKLKKRKIRINAINKEFDKNIFLFEENSNDLFIEYYKLYCAKELNEPNDEFLFFNSEFQYIEKENIEVALHMIEHHELYNYDNIVRFINQYTEEKDKLLTILEKINDKTNEKTEEKDLREQLFSHTFIPLSAKKYDSRRLEGKSFIFLSILLYIIFVIGVVLTADKEIIYSMLNLSLIIPTLVLTSGISKTALKKNNILIFILMFIVLYYFISLIVTIPYHNDEGFVLYTHLKAILYTPVDLIVTLSERMSDVQ